MPDTKKQITKFIGVPLEKGFSHSEEGHLIARGFFTSDKEDAYGDIISKKATEDAVEDYRQWGNIRYMHQPRPVGKVIGIGKADGLKWNEVEFKIVDKQAAYEVEQELLTALSVGILINWADIEITEEGGFLISAYQLAEISLVDHPANYDAKLKSADATEGLRYLAREYGFETVAREMASLLNIQMEGNMPKNEKGIVEGENIEEEVTSEAETEEVDAEVEAEKDASAEVEEESTEEEAEETAETEEVEEEESQEELSVEASITAAFTSGFAKLFDVLESQNAKLDLLLASLETSAEDHGSDQSESEDEEQEAEEVDRGLEGDESDEESAPVNRDGQIPATDSDLSDEGGDEETPEYTKDLKGQLHKFFGIEQEVQV